MVLVDSLVKVKPGQFYGIEIEDFPCQVAQLSILLMKHLMDRELSDYFGMNIIDFPIRENANIVRGNALRLDWKDVCPAEKLDYIIGNPPFLGASMMTEQQKNEAVTIFGKIPLSNSIDYVGAWYHKACAFIQDKPIKVCFVSTNSICQGEQVKPLWDKLLRFYHLEIQFAYRTFLWSNEAKGKAAVYCIIVGFELGNSNQKKKLFDELGRLSFVDHINPYLVDAPDILVESRARPICNVPRVTMGNKPTDDGAFILSSDEKDEIIKSDSSSSRYIREYIGSYEFINGTTRYCLWLKDTGLAWATNKEIVKRVEHVRQFRLRSSAKPTREKADTPAIFFSPVQPESNYILIPRVSSEKRRYIPMGIMSKDVIASDSASIVHTDSLYCFSILTSNVHMSWMRTVGGRLKSDYRYSGSIVYNTFPWPNESIEIHETIERTAQKIIDTRAKYENATMATLYDNTLMPPDLRRAHQDNDRAVWEAYGRAWPIGDESACVAHLMKLYQAKVSEIC